jgi:hypothetical protein
MSVVVHNPVRRLYEEAYAGDAKKEEKLTFP